MNRNPIRILLVDDNSDTIELFQDAFTRVRIRTEVIRLRDGEAVIEYIEAPEKMFPHLVILNFDIIHHGLVQRISKIRNDKHTKHICIALYASATPEEDAETTFVNGANVFFDMPRDADTLVPILEEIIVMFWLYYTSDLNTENFIFRLNKSAQTAEQ